MGQVDVSLSIGNFTCMFLVLVTEELTQPCVLGADFLTEMGCVVHMRRRHLVLGKEIIPLQSQGRDTRGTAEVASYCVALLEDGVPLLHQVQLPVQLLTKDILERDGILKPAKKFNKRHQLLLANSVAHCCADLNHRLVVVL